MVKRKDGFKLNPSFLYAKFCKLFYCKCYIAFIGVNLEMQTIKHVSAPGLLGVKSYRVEGLYLGCKALVIGEHTIFRKSYLSVFGYVRLYVSQ